MRRWKTHCAIALLAGLLTIGQSRAESLSLILPTDNDAIFRGEGAEFYQYIDREFKGEKSNPWKWPLRIRAQSGRDRKRAYVFAPA